MKKATLAPLFGSALAVAALTATLSCSGNSGDDDSGLTGDSPFREEWKTVVDNRPFPLADVKSLTIGRRVGNAAMSNFANRGDIEVLFDLDAEAITIEMRRYTWQRNQAEADETAAKMSLWAYATSSNPLRPSEMDPTLDCTAGDVWQDACAVYVYYDGQSQPVRTGADLRVHLPKAYRQKINIATEDNTEEPNYKLRGDVKLTNFCGSADIKLSSGRADIHFCRELTPGPTCTAQQIDACNTFQVEGAPAPWSKDCPCQSFGNLKVEALDPYAGEITIDMPTSSVWSSIGLRNDKNGQTNTDPDLYCTATMPTCAAPSCEFTQSADTPWKADIVLNYPGPSAPNGAGYAISAVSNGCEAVFYNNGPEDYVESATDAPNSEKRGNITVCDGCLSGV
jgi:hypothetical protein